MVRPAKRLGGPAGRAAARGRRGGGRRDVRERGAAAGPRRAAAHLRGSGSVRRGPEGRARRAPAEEGLRRRRRRHGRLLRRRLDGREAGPTVSKRPRTTHVRHGHGHGHRRQQIHRRPRGDGRKRRRRALQPRHQRQQRFVPRREDDEPSRRRKNLGRVARAEIRHRAGQPRARVVVDGRRDVREGQMARAREGRGRVAEALVCNVLKN
mmetsp:Transcript_3113/g.9304  ORF Transcript_3113/g.9304 Transcript_3113/m.9304 type:complete len:209 (-) Transcript_3113:9-635(-)